MVPAEIILHLPGLSNLQEAVSQKEYNSPLLVAWPWSRTRGACVRILPPGLVINAALHLFNHLLVKHNGDGSFGPTGRAVCSLNFLQNPLLLLALLRAGSLLCHLVISAREVDLHVKSVASRTQQPLQSRYFLLCNKGPRHGSLSFTLKGLYQHTPTTGPFKIH